MISFENDYSAGAHPRIIQRLTETNMEPLPGYGSDVYCENANTNKAASASSKHLFAIKKIKDAKQWDKLPDVLKEIAILREEYPEDSLKELGEKTNPPIGKSGVNHRLSRLVELAETI